MKDIESDDYFLFKQKTAYEMRISDWSSDVCSSYLETPLIAAQAIAILHEAGIPTDVLQLLPGDGTIGAALVDASEVCGVIFTGSTEVARLINAQLAGRMLDDGSPLPPIAETGGQNAVAVDSPALAEQGVGDEMGREHV